MEEQVMTGVYYVGRERAGTRASWGVITRADGSRFLVGYPTPEDAACHKPADGCTLEHFASEGEARAHASGSSDPEVTFVAAKRLPVPGYVTDGVPKWVDVPRGE